MNDYLNEYPDVLNVTQTAEILSVSKQLVRQAIKDKELPAKRIGRVYRIPKHKLIEYLDNTIDLDDTEMEVL